MKKENTNKVEKAEKGMKITFRRKTYTLEEEKVAKGCKGCALYNVIGCPDNITSLCRQGFILKG